MPGIFAEATRITLASVLIFHLGLTGCNAADRPDQAERSSTSSPVTGTAALPISDPSASSGTVVLERANAFMATLSAEQRASLLQPYTFANAARWHTYPQWGLRGSQARIGLALGTLSAPQWEAFNALLAAATGSGRNEGFDEIQQHLAADDWIRQNGGRSGYGRGAFYIAFLGEPSNTGLWQLQFGGHHLAVTNTYRDGLLVGATPSFRAIEPQTEIQFEGATLRPQLDEWEAFVALLASLTPEQVASARLPRRQNALLLGPEASNKDWNFPDRTQGVPVSSLNDQQRARLMRAISLYVNDISEPEAAAILAHYESQLGSTFLAFSGSTSLTNEGDYVRIDGPSVWIELVMDPAYSTDRPHVHAVWRDKQTDYGGARR